MTTNRSTAILLATYNGEAYVGQQLESLRCQSLCADIIVRDDGSTDRTCEVVRSSGAAVIIEKSDHDTDSGHLANFAALCSHAKENLNHSYYLFSDQDDRWFEQKTERLVSRLQELEAAHGADTPLLVHSDLRVTDESLEPVADSFWRYQGLPNPSGHSLPTFFYQNVVTGCACAFNRALLELATPIPKQAAVHDFWFGLLAELAGVVEFIDEPLLAYRQHGKNSIGAIDFAVQRSWLRPYLYRTLWRFPANLCQAINQAKAAEKRLANEGHIVAHKDMLAFFIALPRLSAWQRLRAVGKLFGGKRTIKERVYLYCVLLLLPVFYQR